MGGLWSEGAATRSQLPEGLLTHSHNRCWPTNATFATLLLPPRVSHLYKHPHLCTPRLQSPWPSIHWKALEALVPCLLQSTHCPAGTNHPPQTPRPSCRH